MIFLLGPTAVGKTAISIELAQRWNAEILIADSLQVYRHMDIGTAKPSREERSRVPHHLLDLVEPDQAFTAGDFRRLAQAKVREIWERGRLPLVVGGCGLYIRALVDGLFSGPPQVPEIRKRLQRMAREEGGEALHERLSRWDPLSAARIHPHDTYRIVRALEIGEATGKRPSEVRDLQWLRRKDGPFLFIGLSRPRPSLYRLIEERIDFMIREGFLQEVESLLARFSPDCKPLQALGYRHMIHYLRGRWGWEEMVSLWKRDTRRYAKRQLTWFFKDERIHWFSLEEGEEETCRRVQDWIHTAFPSRVA
ncbi:MAG: tRNA (adenosine(37)-N6)-dimethylallyltransferase MiaA [candidate division NC10 bacterium]|nr:tRNA (adenosine(37)-N6)-dimethylallyltransferase MiaA [candidate division NC10 bacterium]